MDELLVDQVDNNNTKNMKYLLSAIKVNDPDDITIAFAYACETNKLDIIKIMIESDKLSFGIIYGVFWELCIKDNITSAKFIYEHYAICLTHDLFASVYETGKIKVLDWIYSLSKNYNLNIQDYFFMNGAIMKMHSDTVKWLINKNHYSCAGITRFFRRACYDDINIAKFLYNLLLEKYGRVDLDLERLFVKLCVDNAWKASKFIFSIKNDINITDEIFELACHSNDIDVAKWVYSIHKNINIPKIIDGLFTYLDYVYTTINLNMLKWLYELSINSNHIPNIHIYNDCIMKKLLLSERDNDEIILWFYSLDKNGYKKNIQNGILFSTICQRNKLKNAKWLYSLNNNIDIHINYDSTFMVCLYGRCYRGNSLDMLKWIYSLDKEYYNKLIKQNNFEIIGKMEAQNDIDAVIWLKSLIL